ncbi:LamG domain-containing protein [Streptomyces sp. NBC_00690]|uniref:LamG domain-containing protein n=1 Tax=Streptomyces sp. NBC_00690 TaxID=2975808 RepID=UPI002E28CE08|nr:LamG domain-containing protein [Streptomyces sp. NBC_00690]
MSSDPSRTKVYSDRRYLHTTLVRHAGTTVALALAADRRIYYSVLDLGSRTADAAKGLNGPQPEPGQLDVLHWADDPSELRFPGEIARVGFALLGATRLPAVRRGTRTEAAADELLSPTETDTFLSSTARLTAEAPFQALSDGKYLYIFRQSVPAGHEDALVRTGAGTYTGDPDSPGLQLVDGRKVGLANDAVLCDRFIVAGARLLPVPEVRYRRSRHHTMPDSAKDSLGTSDMDGRDFHEPTLELGFLGEVTDGRFAAVLLPTGVGDLRRWQFFVDKPGAGVIDAVNVEQGRDGLFHTQGSRLYTSPDARYRDAVLERSPGKCPFTGADLVPAESGEGFAETALSFGGGTGRLGIDAATPLPLGAGPYTVELWLSPREWGSTLLSASGTAGTAPAASGWRLELTAEGRLAVQHDADGAKTAVTSAVEVPVGEGVYTHVAVVYDGTGVRFCVNGEPGVSGTLPRGKGERTRLVVGGHEADGDAAGCFRGVIDEVRIWDRARTAAELAGDRSYRLVGDEPGLTGYYRFDAGSGTRVLDATQRAAHGTLTGEVSWVTSQAPVGDHPGMRRESFTLSGRSVSSGLSALLYHQQEDAPAGHAQLPAPAKKQARVLVAWASAKDGEPEPKVAALDVAVARDGRLAQLPDVLTLAELGSGAKAVDAEQVNALTAEVDQLRKTTEQAKAKLGRLQKDKGNDAKLVSEAVAARQARLAAKKQLDQERKFGPAANGAPFRIVSDTEGDTPGSLVAAAPDSDGERTLTYAVGKTDETAQWRLVPSGEPAAGNRLIGRLKHVGTQLWVRLNQTYRGIDKYLHACLVAEEKSATVLTLEWDENAYSLITAKGTKARVEVGSGKGGRLKVDIVGTPTVIKAVSVVDQAKEMAEADAKEATLNARIMSARDLDNEGRLRIACDEARRSLEAKEAELGEASGGDLGRSSRSLAMPTLGRDRSGLSWAGALLGFATTRDRPHLLDSGSGQLGLYFRDREGRFTAAYYDTAVGRSVKQLTAGGAAQLLLTAGDPTTDLARVTATVEDAGSADRCRLTLTETADDGTTVTDQEVWDLLPRDVGRAADALNGVRETPQAVGRVSTLDDGTLTLEAGAVRALPAGTLLLVGEQPYLVTTATPDGSTVLAVGHGPAGLPEAAGLAVTTVNHTPALVTVSRAGATRAFGSRLVEAAYTHRTGTLANGGATDLAGVRPSRWWGDTPGRSWEFKDGAEPLNCPQAQAPGAVAADDLTMEAWVKPAATTGPARIINFRHRKDTYVLALGKSAAGKRPVLAGVGAQSVVTEETVPDGQWTHLAASFEQSWALRFAGRSSAVAEHGDALNLTGDCTVEVHVQVDDFTGYQGVISKGRLKGGREHGVPFQLGVDSGGHLVHCAELADGTVRTHVSTGTLTKGKAHRVAVVRKAGQQLVESKGKKTITYTEDGEEVSREVDVIDSMLLDTWFDVTFFIDGEAAGELRDHDLAPAKSSGPLEVGCGWSGADPRHLTGTVSEVRLWNLARDKARLGSGTRTDEGLVAHWHFEENEGNTAADATGAHPLRLHGATWTKNPDPLGSTFRVYLNGRPVVVKPRTADPERLGNYGGGPHFCLGGRFHTSKDLKWLAPDQMYRGELEEVRVWRTVRTEENILDNLFGRLRGEREDLIAVYSFDDDSTQPNSRQVTDSGPRGLHLRLAKDAPKRPTPVLSTAPVSGDVAEVQPVFVKTPSAYLATIQSAPAVQEYADLQRDHYGRSSGALKRVYAYVRDGAWHLVTGYKVGDLVSEWVAQVQFDPQITGYIEGAPPVPSENLIATKSPKLFSYIDATKVEFERADSVVNTLSSSRERSVTAAMELAVTNEASADSLLISAPLGFGIAKPIVEGGFDWGVRATTEFANAWGDETEVSQGWQTGRLTAVGLSGGWETPDAGKQLNKANGRRFTPSNTGYALVQSETADVFALRLAHNRALVCYRMLPNPDIPRDWNLIPFPINPRYTKQGSLDGSVGQDEQGNRVMEEEYQGLASGGELSYFKPREAYALKRRIIEDQQRLQTFYDAVSTETHHADPTAERARQVLSGFVGPIKDPAQRNGKAEPAGAQAKRSLVNTYVWSADGGFFAETTETMDSVTEVTSGSYQLAGSLGGSVGGGVKIFGIGANVQFDASIGGAIAVTRSRGKESTRTFSLNITCDVPGDLQKYDANGDPEYDEETGAAIEVPGRVDAYRFMTFYLDTDTQNFEDFYGKVVDPLWLGGDSPHATALRQARQSDKRPPCWRVLHRVTYVSRKLATDPGTGATDLDKSMAQEDISSNYELIRRIDPYVRDHTADRGELATAVKEALTTHLPGLLPHSDKVTDYFALYYGLDH